MLRDIPSDDIEPALQSIQFIAGGELPFEIGLLIVGEAVAHRFEHGVDGFAVDLLHDVASLVEKRHDSTILHRITDGVGWLDKPTKLPRRALLGLHQRCAGEADVAGFWQRFLHEDVRLAVLTAVAFVHQNE